MKCITYDMHNGYASETAKYFKTLSGLDPVIPRCPDIK